MESIQNISAYANPGGINTKTSCQKNNLLFVVLFTLLVVFLWTAVASTADWKQAVGERAWSFPRDHGSHPEYRTEWWYFTGNLRDDKDHEYGYQLTFFRQGLVKELQNKSNPWAIRDVYLAHFAISDVTRKKFWYAECASRKGPGLAHALEGTMDVEVLHWTAKMEAGIIMLNARDGSMALSLELHPVKTIVFHGEKGLSKKGPAAGQSSYYYSFTNISTKGTIRTPLDNTSVQVAGTSWFDQEFGSNQLTSDQAGWDWFGIHLSDGRDLMIYFMRKKDGTIEKTSSGTLVEKNGSFSHLPLSDIRTSVLERWKSPRSGGVYPLSWQIEIPSARINIKVAAAHPGQELFTGQSTDITYWEGAVTGKGTSLGIPVRVEGYMELTGYAGELGGKF